MFSYNFRNNMFSRKLSAIFFVLGALRHVILHFVFLKTIFRLLVNRIIYIFLINFYGIFYKCPLKQWSGTLPISIDKNKIF